MTIIGISSEEDMDLAKEWVAHLPKYLRKIIVKTVHKGETKKIADNNDVAYFQYGYEDFSFSEARNHALSLVETDWALMLDMDERVQIFEKDVDFISSQPKDVAGLKVRISCYMDDATNNGGFWDVTRVLRKEVRYKYRCHESPLVWIRENGYGIGKCPLVIRHDKYNDKNAMKKSLLRNYHLILDDMMEDRDNRADPKLIGDLYRTIKGFEYVNNK